VNAVQDPRWTPHVTVATVVVRDGHLLLVEERIDGRDVLNQPAGHLEPGESLADAAVRETLEETGWAVRLSAFIGVYQWTAPDGTPFLRFAYAAEALSHDPARRLDTGILRALWLTPAELKADPTRLRSPLVWQVVADYLAGQRHPLSLVKEVA
jgi:8-oxo-dGTP pyrophosphatase MutT (NUDIX family)